MSDLLKPYTAEETRTKMKKIFDDFEKLTGIKPVIVIDTLPVGALFPAENKKRKPHGRNSSRLPADGSS
jgi:hypothetical protein